MGATRLLYRLIFRPMLRERGRSLLILAAISVGVAVVLAIDLASQAATGSFRSSMETLSGDNDLEVTATGGVPETLIGSLVTRSYRLRVNARVEDYATFDAEGKTAPLIGLDLIAQANSSVDQRMQGAWNWGDLQYLNDRDAIWITRGLGHAVGDHVRLRINDESREYVVRGLIPDSQWNADAVVMDIGAAQFATGKTGHVDRILLKVPAQESIDALQSKLRAVIPEGVQLARQGAQSGANRKMLSAFRWNLRILSYIAVLVGAFLIYNTVSISVVRRRPQIGVMRALGASRRAVLFAFLAEATLFGITGSVMGLPLGKLLASGAVRLLSTTVDALYISSRPGAIAFSATSIALAFLIGIGVALASALSPALEASRVSPTEAMARGAREYDRRLHRQRDLILAAVCALMGVVAAQAPAIAGKPFFGYLAAMLLIISCSLMIPSLVHACMASSSQILTRLAGVEALLAARSLEGSLRRTSVLVCALATAIAMMTSVAIMVGSFRQTVISWMDTQLPADLYLRPAGIPAADRHPTLAPDLPERLVGLPGVAAVSRFRAYEIEYQGLPITVASVDINTPRVDQTSGFLSGRAPRTVLQELAQPGMAMVSEPFANKHHVKAGDTIYLPLGSKIAALHIVDIFYDYANERGYVVLARQNMLQYLGDTSASNLAVYLKAGANLEVVRREVEQAVAHRDVLVLSNRNLRQQAIRIFDQTFAITYALEAISVIVAVMGIAGALMSIVFDRRREFGLLHYLGASKAQIRKLILAEAGMIGLLSNIAGLGLGVALSLILVFVINKQSFGWTIRFHWPVSVLLGALTIVYVATILAGLYPAMVAQRLNPIEVVHEE